MTTTRRLAYSIFAACTFVGAALAGGPESAGLGSTLHPVTIADIETDAARRFLEADTDGNGVVDADEYASHSMVNAELARLNGYVVIEGQRATAEVPVPTDRAPLGRAERERVREDAGQVFRAYTDDGTSLSSDGFRSLTRAEFNPIDRDGDGVLSPAELDAYAAQRAAVRPLTS